MLLALDQGGHSSRALIFDESGCVVDRCSVEVGVDRRGDRVEQDPQSVVDSLLQAAEQVTREKQRRERLVVGLACQRSSLVCWRKSDGQALSPILSWQDRRTATEFERWASHDEEVSRLTGLKLSPHYGATKLRWCWENIAAVQEAAAKKDLCWGPLASYLVHRLCVQRPHAVDVANAQRTQLMSIENHDWSPRLLELFELNDVPAEVFPTIFDSSASWGDMNFSWGRAPFRVLTGDQSAVVFADGAPEPGEIRMNFGTGAFLQQVSTVAPQEHPGLLRSVVHRSAGESWWVTEAPVNGARAALQDWASHYQKTPDQVKKVVSEWEPGTDTPLFLNGVSGLAAPFWDPHFQSSLLAETGFEDEARHAGAIIESILFLTRLNADLMKADLMKRTSAIETSRVIVSGGLTRSPGFCRALASLLGSSVFRSEESEGTCRGVAWWLAQSQERNSSGEAWDPSHREEFEPRSMPELEDRYEAWVQEMPEVPS